MSRRLQRASRNLGGEDGWGRKTDDGRGEYACNRS
jgi:hypothetical protein